MNIPKDYEELDELRLTRYLYIYDETVYSFITELLRRSNIDTCYYLISEIYETNPDVIFHLLWKIYFDFYAEHYPSLETCLSNKHRMWSESNSIRPVIFVVKNMFALEASSTVFHLRQFVENGGKCMCLYRLSEKKLLKHNWTKHPKLVCRLFVALERGHIQNAGCYIYKLLETLSSEEIYFKLIEYFSKYIDLKNSATIRKRWDKRIWCNDKHMLLAFIVSMTTPTENIHGRLIFKQPCEEEYNFVEKISCVDQLLPYRILQKKRRNIIVPEIGAFQLAREGVDNYFAAIRDNWEFYAIRSVIWKQRFQRFGGYVKGNKVVFVTEENEDKFYTYFGYELDEQALCVQKLGYATESKTRMSWCDWHAAIFETMPRIILKENFKYKW
tara:strand:- start:20820 stop:21977 length:1158 start_codon:yes stop_codon:yes gene_type:complete